MVILSFDEHLRSTCYLLGTVLNTRLRLGSHFIVWGQRHERWENGREHVLILNLDSGTRYDHLYKQRGQVESEGFCEPWDLSMSGILQLWEHKKQHPGQWRWGIRHHWSRQSTSQAEFFLIMHVPLPEDSRKSRGETEEEPDVLFQQMRANQSATGNWYHYELICSQRRRGLWHSWYNTHNTFSWF